MNREIKKIPISLAVDSISILYDDRIPNKTTVNLQLMMSSKLKISLFSRHLNNHNIKKTLTTLFVVLCAYSTILAQSKNSTEFGVTFGFNGSYLTAGNSNQTTGVLSGFNAGVSADHYFSEAWSLKLKALYDLKGWANGYITTPTTTIEGVNFRLSYITVPLMANWHFGRTRNWYLNFGPYAGFLLSAKEDKYNTDLKSIFSSTDGGLALGIGIKVPISKTAKFFVEYDGQSGVANVSSNSDTTARNFRGSINFGINF
jgi:hypothetical protein